jgi:hypothetical protein
MEYKSYKEFYWKRAIWRLGLPWGFLTGLLVAIVDDKAIFSYFTSWKIIIQLLFFMVGGCFWAIRSGRRYWEAFKKMQDQEKGAV